ncbi:RelE family toxin-antitoxin system [Klebsiella pneumoniae]|nr:RelE family toxin-antitoxin system [Klebsiella pneumoniae]
MTDITELALITIKNQIKSFDTVVLRENEALALVEALEKAQQTIAFQQGEIKALLSSLESRSVTVKLPDLRQVVSGDRYVWSDGVFNYSQDVKAELTAKGIKVEAE